MNWYELCRYAAFLDELEDLCLTVIHDCRGTIWVARLKNRLAQSRSTQASGCLSGMGIVQWLSLCRNQIHISAIQVAYPAYVWST